MTVEGEFLNAELPRDALAVTENHWVVVLQGNVLSAAEHAVGHPTGAELFPIPRWEPAVVNQFLAVLVEHFNATISPIGTSRILLEQWVDKGYPVIRKATVTTVRTAGEKYSDHRVAAAHFGVTVFTTAEETETIIAKLREEFLAETNMTLPTELAVTWIKWVKAERENDPYLILADALNAQR
jgi:hypothetical protein